MDLFCYMNLWIIYDIFPQKTFLIFISKLHYKKPKVCSAFFCVMYIVFIKKSFFASSVLYNARKTTGKKLSAEKFRIIVSGS